MMYEMRRRKPESTLLPTQGTINLPHYIGTEWEELAFDDIVGNWIVAQLNVIAMTRIHTAVPRVIYPAL